MGRVTGRLQGSPAQPTGRDCGDGTCTPGPSRLWAPVPLPRRGLPRPRSQGWSRLSCQLSGDHLLLFPSPSGDHLPSLGPGQGREQPCGHPSGGREGRPQPQELDPTLGDLGRGGPGLWRGIPDLPLHLVTPPGQVTAKVLRKTQPLSGRSQAPRPFPGSLAYSLKDPHLVPCRGFR